MGEQDIRENQSSEESHCPESSQSPESKLPEDSIDVEALLCLMEHTDENLFITGRAGTGKSTLLKRFVEESGKSVIVLAPTGLAAVNVEGQTIHSFFGLPPAIPSHEEIIARRNPSLFKKIGTIIIDEISMARADLFDAMDQILRINRKSEKPFGGVQLILFGDMFQLPPVVEQSIGVILKEKLGYESPYFFSSNAFSTLRINTIELDKVYRQSDAEFIDFLDKVRTNCLPEEGLEYVNSRQGASLPDELKGKEVILATRNYIVDNYNNESLQKLPGEPMSYEAKIDGEFRDNEIPAEKLLKLKKGARVIFLKNDNEKRWVNGTLGTVENLEKDIVHVRIDGQTKTTAVPMVEWNKFRHRFDFSKNAIVKEDIGKFKQFPLRLAWALTIHKSQGQTFEALLLDLTSSPWEHGQLYVALSRCKTLEGLALRKSIAMKDIIVDPMIIEFFSGQKKAIVEKRLYNCIINTDGCSQEAISEARAKSLESFSRLGFDYHDDISCDEQNTIRIGQYGKSRCGICSYIAEMLKKNGGKEARITFERCAQKRKEISNEKPSPSEWFRQLMRKM